MRPAHVRSPGQHLVVIAAAFVIISSAIAFPCSADVPVYSIQPLGLTGAPYSVSTADGTLQISYADVPNSSGMIAGTSNRFSPSGSDLGSDGWLFDGTNYTTLTFTGPGYSYFNSAAGGTYETSQVFALNDANQVLGATTRYGSLGSFTGNNFGQDSWLYSNGTFQLLGYQGTNFSYTVTAGTLGTETYQQTITSLFNTAGQLTGVSQRYDTSGNRLGEDAWFYSNGTTTQIGLTGPGYSYATAGGTYEDSFTAHYNGADSSLNNTGQVIGYSQRYDASGNSLGQDSWIYNGTTTQQIGLTGGSFSFTNPGGTILQSSQPTQLNDAGQAVGTVTVYNGSNKLRNEQTQAWLYSGGTSQSIGLPGTDVEPVQLNAAGQVFGTSASSLGQNTWVYSAGTTTQVGLTGPGYSYAAAGGTYQTSFGASETQINNSGQALGFSRRYSAAGDALGNDAWYYDGATTQSIGLSGTDFSYATTGGTYQSSFGQAINNNGQAIGSSLRFDSSGDDLGRTSWFFDSKTDTTTPLLFSVDTATDYSTSQADILTDAGTVLGTYELYDGSQDEGSHVFYWSEKYGFHDLGTLLAGGLSADGWASLADADGNFPLQILGQQIINGTADGFPEYIAADGLLTGQNSQNGGGTAYLLTGLTSVDLAALTPEPVLSAPLALALLLLHRRRK